MKSNLLNTTDPVRRSNLINKAEAARLLNVSQSTINRMLRDGQLKATKIRGCVRIRQEDVLSILEHSN